MPLTFSGKFGCYTEDELILCGQRWYKPKLTRWLSRDPIGYAGGVNLYGFVEQDPVNYVDITGEEPVSTAIGIGLGGGEAAVAACGLNPALCVATLGSLACVASPWCRDTVDDLASNLLDELDSATDRLAGLINTCASEHSKNKRPSTVGKHEKGNSRRKKDKGGEKGDDKRRWPSKRPDWYPNKGPYPPKP